MILPKMAGIIGALFAGLIGVLVSLTGSDARSVLNETNASVEALLQELDHSDPEQRQKALNALSELGPNATDAVPQLIAIVKDTTEERMVRVYANHALGRIGIGDDRAASALEDVAKNEQGLVRDAAIIALGWLGPNTEAFLRSVLEDGDPSAQRSAAQALGRIGPAQPETVTALLRALMAGDSEVQRKTATALGSAKAALLPALNGLIDYVARDPATTDANARFKAAAGLEDLAATARTLPNAATFLPTLRRARDILVSDADERLEKNAKNIEPVISLIEMKSQMHPPKIQQHSLLGNNYILYSLYFVLFYLLIIICIIVLLFISPESLLRIQTVLGPVDASSSNNRRKLTIGRFFWLGALTAHPRVLDAWVARRLPIARARFETSETVSQLGPRVPLPVLLGNQLVENFQAATLRPIFCSSLSFLLIHGEGGIGKTSLACQIGRWAISSDPENRVSAHPMLPILIDDDLEEQEGVPFLAAINRRLQHLVDSPAQIPGDLLLALLRSRRVLVIVDRFSELNMATRRMVQPDSLAFPVNALIVTSRLKENLGIELALLRPLSIYPDKLSVFLIDYLKCMGKADPITDDILSEARRNLAFLVQDTPITVLLAKLYAEQLVYLIEVAAGDLQKLPRSIPELMLKYVSLLNESIGEDKVPTHKVHADLKLICSASMQHGFYPAAAPIDRLLQVLGGPDAESRLAYIQDRLCLTVAVDPPGYALRLRLDPLAELLSALHVSETYASDSEAWFALFDSLKGQPLERPANGGFIRALASVCRNYRDEHHLSDFAVDSVEMFAAWLKPSSEVNPTEAR